jgi:hypothetical protein
LGIVTIIEMTLGKVYYDPKHAAGYGSVANLVKASETNGGVVVKSEHVYLAQTCS